MNDPYIRQGIAIINPYGGIWTNEIFETPEAALRHLKKYWSNNESFDPSKWRLAMATQTVTLNRTPGEPIFMPLPAVQ